MKEIRMSALSRLIVRESNLLGLRKKSPLRFFRIELFRKILRGLKRQGKRRKGSKSSLKEGLNLVTTIILQVKSSWDQLGNLRW